MKIYIEAIILIICFGILILWKLWYMYSTWRALRKYKPENDLGKLAEDRRKELINDGKSRKTEGGLGEPTSIELGRTEPVEESSNDSIRSGEPEERELLQEATVDPDGSNKCNPKRNSTRVGKLKSIFKRRRT